MNKCFFCFEPNANCVFMQTYGPTNKRKPLQACSDCATKFARINEIAVELDEIIMEVTPIE